MMSKMKINFDQIILGLDKKPVNFDGEDMTLGFGSAFALNAPEQDPIQSLKRGMLAVKLYEGGEVEISPEEATLIRSALPKAFAPVIVFRMSEMLGGT